MHDQRQRPDRKPDFVTIALVTVAVVSLVVVISELLTVDGPETTEMPVLLGAPLHTGVGVPEGFTDPRGPERGPTPLEWEVIRVYKVIENMTAADPPVLEVERALERLREYTNEHADNPFIQETYLKGLRVAAYYADPDDPTRIQSLHERFVTHAARWEHFEHVVVETMWYRLDRIHANLGCSPELAEMERLFALVPENEEAENAFLWGLQVALDSGCVLTPSEAVLWTDWLRRLEQGTRENG
ncbi:MAG: hypothetical protein V3U67_09680 [Gemmatimonadota bacterium]